jgi:hypothetical protein
MDQYIQMLSMPILALTILGFIVWAVRAENRSD